MLENLTSSLSREISKEVKDFLPNIFERYLAEGDKKEIQEKVKNAEEERGNFWEKIWGTMVKEGKSYVKQYIPEVDRIMDFVEAGKNLVHYDLAGFLKTIIDKKNIITTFIPETVLQKIVDACIECEFFMQQVNKFDPELSANIRNNKEIKDVVKGIQLLATRGISEYKISDMIKPMVMKKIPFINN